MVKINANYAEFLIVTFSTNPTEIFLSSLRHHTVVENLKLMS